MKILFTTDYAHAPSTVFNMNLLKYLDDFNGVKIDFLNFNYKNYDVILFMGYDPKIAVAREANPKIKIGVIDPREAFSSQPVGADFILANGIEMKDWCLKYTGNIFIYYIYPILENIPIKKYEKSNKIVIGYHGNKIHLMASEPRITKALEVLAEEYDVEFWTMYNIKELGRWQSELEKGNKVKVKHIQWAEENYQHLAKVDIGIVPSLIPMGKKRSDPFCRFREKKFNEHKSDYLLRFKSTCNAGRVFVFTQLGIPVVADMFPSALQLIDDGKDGFVCYSTESWFSALHSLSAQEALREKFALKATEKFDRMYSPTVLNKQLLDFLKKI